MRKNKYNFTPDICHDCGQSKTYLLPIDLGTCLIVQAFANAVKRKGINMIHPHKEMQVPNGTWRIEHVNSGYLSSIQIGNMTRARVHGLLARVKGEAGNWVLTAKGKEFLKGGRIPRLAVIQKTVKGNTSHKMDYYFAEVYTCTIHDILSENKQSVSLFEPIDFDIQNGRVVKNEYAN